MDFFCEKAILRCPAKKQRRTLTINVDFRKKLSLTIVVFTRKIFFIKHILHPIDIGYIITKLPKVIRLLRSFAKHNHKYGLLLPRFLYLNMEVLVESHINGLG